MPPELIVNDVVPLSTPSESPVTPGKSSNSKRGTFAVSGTGSGLASGSNGATAFTQACMTIPATVTSINSDHSGNTAYATHPWFVNMVSYNHVMTPNTSTCQDTSGEVEPDATTAGYVGPFGGAPATSNHPGGVQMAMSDGSVRFVKDGVYPQTWWAIATRAGGEVIDSSSL